MADILNDGSVAAGSRDINIGGTVYATDDFKYDIGVGATILRTDKNSVPSGRKVARGEITGSATLQLATTSTALPTQFAQFTEAEGVHSVLTVGRAETKGGETKVPITFVRNITGSVVVT